MNGQTKKQNKHMWSHGYSSNKLHNHMDTLAISYTILAPYLYRCVEVQEVPGIKLYPVGAGLQLNLLLSSAWAW